MEYLNLLATSLLPGGYLHPSGDDFTIEQASALTMGQTHQHASLRRRPLYTSCIPQYLSVWKCVPRLWRGTSVLV